MDIALHKEAVLKERLKPWLEEACAVIGNIEGKFVTLQAMQQQLQADSTGAVTEKRVEDEKQAIAQCTTKVTVIRVELNRLPAKIFMPIE